MTEYIDIVMSKGPGPDSEFIEVEDDEGASVKVGEWIAPGADPDMPDDRYWRFRIHWTAIGEL